MKHAFLIGKLFFFFYHADEILLDITSCFFSNQLFIVTAGESHLQNAGRDLSVSVSRLLQLQASF